MTPSVNTILIIEDDYDFQILAKTVLSQRGYTVLSVFDGALEKILDQIIYCDVVLLDVELPEGNGVEISNILKCNRTTAHIPIIMVTGEADADTICKQAQADDWLAKPFTTAALLEKIENVLSNRISYQQ